MVFSKSIRALWAESGEAERQVAVHSVSSLTSLPMVADIVGPLNGEINQDQRTEDEKPDDESRLSYLACERSVGRPNDLSEVAGMTVKILHGQDLSFHAISR